MGPVQQAELALELARAEEALSLAKAGDDLAELRAAKHAVRAVRQRYREAVRPAEQIPQEG